MVASRSDGLRRRRPAHLLLDHVIARRSAVPIPRLTARRRPEGSGANAPGAEAHVNLAYRADRLRLTIENDTAQMGSANGSRPGVGILGMRERAVALGGTLQADRSGEGFRVFAELPYRPST